MKFCRLCPSPCPSSRLHSDEKPPQFVWHSEKYRMRRPKTKYPHCCKILQGGLMFPQEVAILRWMEETPELSTPALARELNVKRSVAHRQLRVESTSHFGTQLGKFYIQMIFKDTYTYVNIYDKADNIFTSHILRTDGACITHGGILNWVFSHNMRCGQFEHLPMETYENTDVYFPVIFFIHQIWRHAFFSSFSPKLWVV